jgi:hypothetical protein
VPPVGLKWAMIHFSIVITSLLVICFPKNFARFFMDEANSTYNTASCRQSCFLHQIIKPGNTLTGISNRVFCTVQQKRHFFIPTGIIIGFAGSIHRAKQFPEKTCGNVLSDQRIRKVLIQCLCIVAEPVCVRSGGIEFLVIGTKRQLPDQTRRSVETSLSLF